jgi:hypothetical protein
MADMLPVREVNRLRLAFDGMDTDGSGVLSVADAITAMRVVKPLSHPDEVLSAAATAFDGPDRTSLCVDFPAFAAVAGSMALADAEAEWRG